MFRTAKRTGASASAIAAELFDGQLTMVLAKVRQRLRQHAQLTSALTAILAGVGAFSLASIASFADAWHVSPTADAVLLAVGASVVTTATLFPLLRQRERWLLQAMSTITHDNIDLLAVLGKLTELRNGETAGHNLRVSLYALLFAEALELPPQVIVRTVKGALLHDVGKLATPDRILGKPGRLTPDERTEMAKHVRYGLAIVSESQVLQEAAAVVGGHHEHYDGSGYPSALKGEAIPYEARVFALVDVFDALTSARAYKPAFAVEDALATMSAGRGSHFDPDLFDRFVALAPAFAKQVHTNDAAFAAPLMARLRPYFEPFMLGWAMSTPRPDGQAAGAEQA